MMMHPETTKTEAFNLVTQAQSYIQKYNELRELGEMVPAHASLKSAAEKLNKAVMEDPKYLGALYYRGVVGDLRGKATDAVKDLEIVLKGVKEFTQKYEKCWPTIEQVKYNLAVAYYHRYGHTNLEAAAGYFEQVMKETKESNPRLYLLAQAGLAQAYAMRMIPTLPRDGTYEQCVAHLHSPEVRKDVKKYFESSTAQSNEVLAELEKKAKGFEDSADEIGWIAYNARAIALMYYTDFYEDERLEKLADALDALAKAEALSPKNWSLYCNFGSAYMRLGHWLQAQSEANAAAPPPVRSVETLVPAATESFVKAEKRLTEVIEVLRKNYGFALYELGRNYRLMGSFGDALKKFAAARRIPVSDRAVSDDRLNFERTRAERKLTDYP
jgi:tetratricopeptide (TPR) repeat protein